MSTPKDNIPIKESHTRSLLKGLSWRIVATCTIMIIIWYKTGDLSLAGQVGFIEFIVKYALYYFHERAWQLVPRGGVRKMFGSKKVK